MMEVQLIVFFCMELLSDGIFLTASSDNGIGFYLYQHEMNFNVLSFFSEADYFRKQDT
jgi:hypothetical protein